MVFPWFFHSFAKTIGIETTKNPSGVPDSNRLEQNIIAPRGKKGSFPGMKPTTMGKKQNLGDREIKVDLPSFCLTS